MAMGASTEGKKGLLSLGSVAPDFKLQEVTDGRWVSLGDFADKKALVVIFTCRHCPFAQHAKPGIIQLAKDYKDKSVGVVLISSNDPDAYEDDSPESLREMAIQDGFPSPLLFDETQSIAKAYTAVTTPDVFVFDKDRKLVYRGQFDDARPGNDIPVTGKDTREAIDAVLEGRPVSPVQNPSIGCGIKWKPGNTPDYF